MEPPFGPNLIAVGPFAVRWYAVCILGGAMLGALLGSYRAKMRGYKPDHAWDGLVMGLIISVICARAWYVASSWAVYKNKSFLEIINPAQGGIAIHGATASFSRVPISSATSSSVRCRGRNWM